MTFRFTAAVSLALCVAACATTQSGYRPLGASYPPKTVDAPVEVFEAGEPNRSYERVARLDTHFEKTSLVSTSHAAGITELQKQARAAGADAIIEVREIRSRVGETLILHLTGIGVRYVTRND